jgi:hypothetical protein
VWVRYKLSTITGAANLNIATGLPSHKYSGDHYIMAGGYGDHGHQICINGSTLRIVSCGAALTVFDQIIYPIL